MMMPQAGIVFGAILPKIQRRGSYAASCNSFHLTSCFSTTMSAADPNGELSDSLTLSTEASSKPPKIWWSNAVFFLSVHIAAIVGLYHAPPRKTHAGNIWLWLLTWQLADFGYASRTRRGKTVWLSFCLRHYYCPRQDYDWISPAVLSQVVPSICWRSCGSGHLGLVCFPGVHQGTPTKFHLVKRSNLTYLG